MPTQTKPSSPLFGLIGAQFIEAFSDNAWKLIIFTLATRSIPAGPELNRTSQVIATLSLLAFLLPMLFFSIPSSLLADRFSKRSIIVFMKLVGIVLMGSATIALWIAPTNLIPAFIILTLMGVQGAIFSPAKYGILPEMVPLEQLSRGNAFLETSSMLAIIFGTGLGPILLAADKGGTHPSLTFIAPLILTGMACLAWRWSLMIPPVPPARQKQMPPIEVLTSAWHAMRSDKILWLALVGSILYWLILSLTGQNVLVFAKFLVLALNQGEIWQGIPPAAFGAGIVIGALLASKISGARIEYGLMPFGAIGFALGSFLLGLLEPGMITSILILLEMGISIGLLVVPLRAIIQWRAPPDKRGSIIALGNILDIMGLISGSVIALVMALIGLQLNIMLILSGVIILLVAAWANYVAPHALPHLSFMLLSRFLFATRVKGNEKLPEKGPLLLVSPLLSFKDILTLTAFLNRRLRLVLPEHHYQSWWAKPWTKFMGAIPISEKTTPETFMKELNNTHGYIHEHIFLCILPKQSEALYSTFIQNMALLKATPESVVVPVFVKGPIEPLTKLFLDRCLKAYQTSSAAIIIFGEPLKEHASSNELESFCTTWNTSHLSIVQNDIQES